MTSVVIPVKFTDTTSNYDIAVVDFCRATHTQRKSLCAAIVSPSLCKTADASCWCTFNWLS